MLLIVFFIFLFNTVLSGISNYPIALDKYASGASFSNEEKEYLEKMGRIITAEI